MRGYVRKKFGDLTLFIREEDASVYADHYWRETCQSIFSGKLKNAVRKEGTYKTILHMPVGRTACIIKLYKNTGLPRLIKSFVRRSRARHEFLSAVAVHHKGIATPIPVLAAERGRAGCVQAGLVAFPLLTQARELRDIFLEDQALSRHERRAIASAFGSLTAKIFQEGVFQYDYSLNNFMAQTVQNAYHLFFIDLERVQIKSRLSPEEKMLLLAKLNRVGNSVSLAERLRFLKAYMLADPGIAPGLKQCARTIQHMTFGLLKKDLARRRLTSPYTHGHYEKIRLHGFAGLHKKCYQPEALIRKLSAIEPTSGQTTITLRCDTAEHVITVLQFKRDGASRMWAVMNTLLTAGVQVELPEALVEDKRRGFVLMSPSACRSLSSARFPTIVTETFAQELAFALGAMADLSDCRLLP